MVDLGVHVGEGARTILQNYATEIGGIADFSLTPGSMTSFGATAELPIRRYLAVGTGLDFTINNYYYSMTVLEADQGTLNTIYSRNHFYTLDIPVYLSFRFNLGTRVRWHNEIGGFIALGCGGKTRTKAYASSTNSLGQSQVTEMSYSRDYFSDDDAIINGITNTDWGLHLATGVAVHDHWQVKCVFRVGARDLAKNFGVLGISNHSLSVAFRIGYLF